MTNPEFEIFGKWKFLTNRINPLLKPIAEKLDIFLNALDEPIRRECLEKIELKSFTYWDTFYTNGIVPNIVQQKNIIKVLPKTVTDPLSDKMALGREMISRNLSEYFPKTYESIHSAIESINPQKTPLAFIKLKGGSAGLQVKCVKTNDLPTLILEPDYIIQEGINEIFLLENRKIEFRFYLVIFNKKIFLSKHAFYYIHGGEEYDNQSTDYLMQVKKTDGIYFRREVDKNSVKVGPLFELESQKNYINQLTDLSRAFKSILEVARSNSDENSFILLGCDAIPCLDNTMKLIEINTYPNLIHIDPKINELVNIPVLKSTIFLTMIGESDYSWIEI